MEITKFSELSELKQMIEDDFNNINVSAHRFPIRFIFLNSHEELNEVMDLMIDIAKKVELSSFLLRDDSWFTPNDVIRNIEDINETSVVVPLSEYIRFLDDEKFKMVLSALAEIENKPFRIFVPLVGLWERFETLFYNNFYRYENWAPVWKLKSPSKSIKIYQIAFDFNKDIKTNDLKLISNSREWFELWKQDDVDVIISLIRPLLTNFHNSLPDQTFTQDVINTPREYLSKIHGIDVDIAYDELDKPFWDDLLIYVSNGNKKNISFNDIIEDKFNISSVSKIGLDEYLDIYLSNITNQYNQWLIKNFIILFKRFDNTYLSHCFKSMEKLGNNNLARKIFLEIFKLEYSEEFLEERRLLLVKLNKYDLSFAVNDFEHQFKNIEHLSYKKQFKYLTTITLVEKDKIFEIIGENGFDNIINDIKVIYPELYHYLDWNFTLNEDVPLWILNYFKEYNKSKVLNFKSETIDDLLIKNNNPHKFHEWYYKFSRPSIIKEDNNYIVWVDALGLEWLPLLVYSLNQYGKSINKSVKFKTINSVNLPSATEYNKVTESDLKISNLDEYIHKNTYTYPKSLQEEIEVIKEISRAIVKIDSPKVTIVSDHGFSYLCTKHFGGYKKHKFKNAKHEGRYLNWDKEDVIDEDYMSMKSESPVHENERYLITLKHIGLYNTPSHEVHGGATPEEVLVPYIVLEDDDRTLVEYEIIALDSSINISKDTQLRMIMSPQPHSLPIVICNNEVLSVSKDNNQFIIQLNSNLNKGLQKFIIKLDDEEVGELEINIKKGGMEEEDYGALFG